MARSLVLTPLPNLSESERPLGFSLSEVTRIRFLRRKSRASSWRSKLTSPAWVSPARVRPFHRKTGIEASGLGRPAGRAQVDLDEHLFELGGVGGAVHRFVDRDLAVGDRHQEPLVHGLHAVLLPGLHERV